MTESEPNSLKVKPSFRGLFFKFLAVLVPVFLMLEIPGFYILTQYESSDHEAALANRMGNQAARVAGALARHDAQRNPMLARDFLASMASDSAFLCAELRARDDNRMLASIPQKMGCSISNRAHHVTLSTGQNNDAILLVQFSSQEIAASQQLRQTLTILLVVFGFVVAALAAAFGFHFIVNRPLNALLAGIRRNAETGERIHIEVAKQDEIGAVSVAFNEMLEHEIEREEALVKINKDLQRSEEELKSLSEELEDRVRTRTSELKTREAALFQSEQRYKDFSVASSDWHWEMDEELRFSYFSDRFAEVTGVDTPVLLGKTREETGIPDVDPVQWQDHLSALHNQNAFRNFIHPRQRANAETAWFSINGVPYFSEDGVFKGYRGTGSDITDLIEARLEAEAANRAKSEFLSSMSHELRTPLNSILGFGQLLDDNPRVPLDDGQKRFVSQILKNGEHLLHLINRLLDLAKIEAAEISMTIEDVPISEALEDCVGMARSLIKSRDVELIVEPTPSAHKTCRADKGMLRQALLNLLSNAIKYTSDGGTVAIRSRYSDPDTVQFSISDTGQGIPLERQNALFEPFNRLGLEAGSIEGTGIGLTITKHLVNLMGGEIDFESTAKEGSTFWINLPTSKPTDAQRMSAVE